MPRKKTKEEIPMTGEAVATKPKKVKSGTVDIHNESSQNKPSKARIKDLGRKYVSDSDWIYERQSDGSFKRMWFRGLH